MTLLFESLTPRRADPPPYPQNRKCLIFRWIGQSFEHCDRCGLPEREHLYHPPYGGSRPIFRVKEYHGESWRKERGWFWMPVGSLVKTRPVR